MFDSLQYDTRESQKYFSPLVSGTLAQQVKMMRKKTEGQKYCWNVPKRDKKTCYKRNNFELAKSEHIAEREVILNVLCFYFNSIKLLLHRFY